MLGKCEFCSRERYVVYRNRYWPKEKRYYCLCKYHYGLNETALHIGSWVYFILERR